MIRAIFVILFVILGTAFTACTNISGSDFYGDASLNAAQEVFTETETVELILKNESNTSLYLEYCGPAMIFWHQVMKDDRWSSFNFTICLDIYIPEFRKVLDPGESKTITLDVFDFGLNRFAIPYKLGSSDSEEKTLTAEFWME